MGKTASFFDLVFFLIITSFEGYRIIWMVLTSREKVLALYFVSKAQELYKYSIYKLVDKWNEVLGNNEGYVND